MKIRLARIDAPEVRGDSRPAGLLARDWLRERIEGKTVLLRTERDKTGKFGRYLGEVWIDDRNINDEIVEAGLAVYRDY